jgi:hypothetical protein
MCVTSMISVTPDLRFLLAAPCSLGFLFGPSLCLFMVWPSPWQMEQHTLFFIWSKSPKPYILGMNGSRSKAPGDGDGVDGAGSARSQEGREKREEEERPRGG